MKNGESELQSEFFVDRWLGYPVNLSGKILRRYLSLDRFKDFVLRGYYFPLASQFSDDKELHFPPKTFEILTRKLWSLGQRDQLVINSQEFTERALRSVRVSCWHDPESGNWDKTERMWREYCRDGYGVAFDICADDLVPLFEANCGSDFLSVYRVEYLADELDWVSRIDRTEDIFRFKRKSFEFESEVRFVRVHHDFFVSAYSTVDWRPMRDEVFLPIKIGLIKKIETAKFTTPCEVLKIIRDSGQEFDPKLIYQRIQE